MQVLTSRFDLNDQRVWFGRAKMLADRIVLKGIGYHRRIMLDEIVEVRWAADDLVIVLRDGDEVDMNIRSAALWKYELQARCGLSDAAGGVVLPGGSDAGRQSGGTSESAPGAALSVTNGTEDGPDKGDGSGRDGGDHGNGTAYTDGSDDSGPDETPEQGGWISPAAPSERLSGGRISERPADPASGRTATNGNGSAGTVGEQDVQGQTDLFLQRESTYRIRSSFADDRPGTDKRGGD